MELTDIFTRSRKASKELALADAEVIDRVLQRIADEAVAHSAEIIEANALDLAAAGKDNPMYDRLMLDRGRIEQIADDIRGVAGLPSPVGETIQETVRPNGMTIRKVRVPLGVVGVIYEARPNVSFDVFALCFKSSNACLLKGGSDAALTNKAIVRVIRETLAGEGINPDAVILLPPSRAAAEAMLTATGQVDVVIPRGSASLIRYVRDHARVPVIETGAGICHTYFDRDGDAGKGTALILNAKTRRVSVCNALDTLIVHSSRLDDLPRLCGPLARDRVTIYADPRAYSALAGNYPAELLEHASEESFGTEFLDYKMSVKTVDSPDEAVAHIDAHGSRHSECIVTENPATAAAFTRGVDAACVYTNVSTAFTDGAQFGFGAEIGISTQKLHARGPMALPELTTYKYVISGDGQTRW